MTLKRLVRRVGSKAVSLVRAWTITEAEKRTAKWLADNGNETLFVTFPDLTRDSLVFDLGGFKGQWASDIFARYLCRIHVFEPVPEFAARIRERFRNNPAIQVHEFGLAGRTREEALFVDADGSSLFRPESGKRSIPIRLVRARDFIESEGIGTVDLMKINIEGGEYELLEHLLDEGVVPRIRNITIQFHNYVEHAGERMEAIQRRLAATHELTYQYRFVFENWRLRDGKVTSA